MRGREVKRPRESLTKGDVLGVVDGLADGLGDEDVAEAGVHATGPEDPPAIGQSPLWTAPA